MASEIRVVNNQDALLIEVDAIPSGYSNDGIFYKTVSGKHYKIPNDGTIRAVKAGILFDGTNQTARINTILGTSDVRELVFDSYGKSCTITGTVTVPAGKKLVFRNDCKIIGSGTIDGGLIDCDLLKQCFGTSLTVINLLNTEISVIWFGAVADYKDDGTTAYIDATDNQPLFKKALDARKDMVSSTLYQVRSKLYIPAGEQNYSYYMGDTWVIDAKVNVYGDGIGITKITVKSILGAPAILVSYPVTSLGYLAGTVLQKGGTDIVLKGFSIFGIYYEAPNLGGGVAYDNKSHGIKITTNNCKFEDIEVQKFAGNGWDIFANVSDIPSSNANNCIFENIKGNYNSGSGIRFKGTDANNCRIYNADFQGNGRWGVNEDSFLGNLFSGIHTASNGLTNTDNRMTVHKAGWHYRCLKPVVWKVSHNGNRYHCILAYSRALVSDAVAEPGVGSSWATYWSSDGAGAPNDTYVAFKDYDMWYFNTATIEPEVTTDWATYWEKYEAGGSTVFAPDWDATKWYAEGGSYLSSNVNQRSVFTECYSEADQRSAVNRGSSLFLGGFAAKDGQMFGGIGIYQGKLNVEELQIFNENEGDFGLQIIRQFDGETMYMRVYSPGISQNFGWKLYRRGGWYFDNDLFAVLNANIIGTWWSGLHGRSTTPAYGMAWFPRGVWLPKDDSLASARIIKLGTVSPVAGEHAIGDIVINCGTDDSIVLWKCTTAGTPGTWQAVLAAGSSTGRYAPLASFYTDVSNSSSTETDLYSHTLAGNKLVTNGDKIIAEFFGTYNSPTSAVLKFYFAGAVESFTGISANQRWKIRAVVVKTGTTTGRLFVELLGDFDNVIDQLVDDVTGVDWTSTNIMKITGQDTSSTKITAKLGSVDVVNY